MSHISPVFTFPVSRIKVCSDRKSLLTIPLIHFSKISYSFLGLKFYSISLPKLWLNARWQKVFAVGKIINSSWFLAQKILFSDLDLVHRIKILHESKIPGFGILSYLHSKSTEGISLHRLRFGNTTNAVLHNHVTQQEADLMHNKENCTCSS